MSKLEEIIRGNMFCKGGISSDKNVAQALTDKFYILEKENCKERIAIALWEVARNDAHLSMMVKPWSETNQAVKDFYYKQAQAIIKMMGGDK